MTSCKHAALITYFLLEILRSGAPIPRIAVCNFSKAILIALSRVFARSADLSDYLQICYNILILKLPQSKPHCYIRLDVSHIIATVARWSCLKGKPPKIRQFFLRSVAHACQMTSFVQHLLKSTLVVALSQEIGRREDNTYLDSEIHLRYVNTIIKGSTKIEETTNDEAIKFQMEENEDMITSWTHWTESIIENAKTIASKSQNGDNVNAFFMPQIIKNVFFMPQIIKNFKILLRHVPLWTGVMRPIFASGENTATSSSVEAEFANLKCRVFNGQLPMRVDKFVLRHVEYLRDKLILASDKINHMHCKENTHSFATQDNEITNISSNSISLPINQEDLKKNNKIIVDSHCDSWNETENWRGLHNIKNMNNKSISSNHPEKQKKATYLDNYPDWDYLKSNVAVGIPLLKIKRCSWYSVT